MYITNIKFPPNLINSLGTKYNKCKCNSLMHAHKYAQTLISFLLLTYCNITLFIHQMI